MKKLFLVLAAALLACSLFACGTSPNSTPAPSKASGALSFSMSVSCHPLLATDEELAAKVSEEGVILPETPFSLAPGATLADALVESGITFSDTQGYVEAIQSLAAGDGGPASGWVYRVNGEFLFDAYDAYLLQEGDEVEWLYTCDGGPDVGMVFDDSASAA